jgi:hypothetical protein
MLSADGQGRTGGALVVGTTETRETWACESESVRVVGCG